MKPFNKPKTAPASVKAEVFRLPSQKLRDLGKVQLGGLAPAFRRALIVDKGKVRLGGLGPIFR